MANFPSPYYDGKRWRINHPAFPSEGLPDFASCMRWAKAQREIEDLL
jgi:hypothetical protein